MLSKDEILSVKLSSRCCRKKLRDLPNIKAIVEECSAGLGMKAPELICCESLTRSFSAFSLMGEPYLIYDACLIEALYIYDQILASGTEQQDMDKFFYKLFGEECIRNGDLVHALYFAGKYRNLKYSFEEDSEDKPVLTLRIKTFEVFQRVSPLPDGLPNLSGGCTPWRCHTLATDTEKHNLASADAALVLFCIGYLAAQAEKSL